MSVGIGKRDCVLKVFEANFFSLLRQKKGICDGLNLSPQYVETLTLRASKCDFIWRQ